MNENYKKALNRKIKSFISDFSDYSRQQYTKKQGKLTHPGSFGNSREKIVKNLISSVVPGSKECHVSGFIMNSRGALSREQDLIFYDKNSTPILTIEDIGYFPVETVVAVGQVKSVIRNRNDLKKALQKLSEVKKIRDDMGHSSVGWRYQDFLWDGRDSYSNDNVYDQVFTFIVCEKIDFEISPDEINKLYEEDFPDYLRHNLILDISKGIYSYRTGNDMSFVSIPVSKNNVYKVEPSFIKIDSNNIHLIHFLTNLSIFISNNTLYYPDMGVYLSERPEASL